MTRNTERTIELDRWFPRIVCLCGSTRFKEEFEAAARRLALEGKIVLTVGFFGHRESMADASKVTDEQKDDLDELHKRKIDLADEILVINVNGYVGSSTRSEIVYALGTDKPIHYLEPPHGSRLETVEAA